VLTATKDYKHYVSPNNDIKCSNKKILLNRNIMWGNICSIKDRLDVLYMCSSFLFILAVHVSGAICTHPQEHQALRSYCIHAVTPNRLMLL
jgi:hypothetical protein